MTQYTPVLDLWTLDGANGFQINLSLDWNSNQSVAFAGDVNGDGRDDMILCDGGGGNVVFANPSGFGAVFDAGDLDGNDGFVIEGQYSAGVGTVSSAGDVNGDGFDDLLIGSPFAYFQDYYYSGAAYVVFGKGSAFDPTVATADLDGTNGFEIQTLVYGDYTGGSVSGAGDVNGDGFDDVIVGANRADPHGSGSGTAFIVFGKASGFSASIDPAGFDGTNGFRINGEVAGDSAGRSVSAAGDVNGDGFADVIIGARGADPNGIASGASYVVFGKASGFAATLELSSLDGNNGFQINGEAAQDYSGRCVASAGDINADGFDDILVGAFEADANGQDSGAAYVVFGRAAGLPAVLELSSLDGTDGFVIGGLAPQDYLGFAVASAGDFNGDGFGDVIVGARGANVNGDRGAGSSYILFGKAEGFDPSFDLSSLDGNNGIRIDGEGPFGRSGSALSAGDVNADGFSDVLIAAPTIGTSYVVYGSMPGEAVVRTGTAIANTIHGGDFDDTLNGLAGDDALIGHNGADMLKGGAGRDALAAGKGNDVLVGGNAKDTLDGGPGTDTFRYGAAADSTSKNGDTIKGADFTQDAFDLATAVTDVDATISTGLLRKGQFDADLAAAADAAHLGANHAVIFTPDAGNQAGKTFLIVDMGGGAGYQAGQDLVVVLTNPLNLASLGTEDFI